MDDFFQELNKISSREDLLEAVGTVRQKLGQIKGVSKLEFTLRLLKWIEQYPLLRVFAEEIINDVLELAKETSTEQAALLLQQKAYYDYASGDIPEATHFSDLALKKSRDIGSNIAEVDSLIVKGFMCDGKKEHKKASAWYAMALAKCTKFKRPGLMLNMGTSLRMQGEYSQAWSFINQAKSLASDLSNDLSLEDMEKTDFNLIVARAYLQLGQVHEGIGDFDDALRAYDIGLSLSLQYGFTNEISQIYHHQAKVYSVLGWDSEAVATMEKAVEVLSESENIDPIIYFDYLLYMVRKLKNEKHYEIALDAYRYILFEDTTDAQTGFMRLNDFMDNETNTFSEIVKGIAECLHATGRITESETINKQEAAFSELKQQTGIDKDRNYKLRIQKNRLGAVLRQVFYPEPDFVEYKNIQAKYDPKKDKATFTIGDNEIKRSRRYFLVFKCLVDKAGKRVSGETLNKFVIEQGDSVNEEESGLRTYVARIKKDLNMAQFFEPPSRFEGKGWKLKAP